MGNTKLIFIQNQTREGLQWQIYDQKTNRPVNLTGATINVKVVDYNDGTIIINRNATVTSPATNGICTLAPTLAEMSRIGTYDVQITTTFGDGTISILTGMQIVIVKGI
jgi:hypothetical protein